MLTDLIFPSAIHTDLYSLCKQMAHLRQQRPYLRPPPAAVEHLLLPDRVPRRDLQPALHRRLVIPPDHHLQPAGYRVWILVQHLDEWWRGYARRVSSAGVPYPWAEYGAENGGFAVECHGWGERECDGAEGSECFA